MFDDVVCGPAHQLFDPLRADVDWTNYDQYLGVIPDGLLARMMGISLVSVRLRRIITARGKSSQPEFAAWLAEKLNIEKVRRE